MAKIFFDHQKFSTQKYGGISRYFSNIINEIDQRSDIEQTTGVVHSGNHYLKKNLALPDWANKKLADPKLAYKLNAWYCKHLLKGNDFDVFHPTYYDPYFLPLLKKPLITTIHDMTYERLPEYFWAEDPLTMHKRLSIERADLIIAISETTKKDLIEIFNVQETRVEVVYHGIDLTNPLHVKPIANLPTNYLLFVGDRSGYKNFYLFMQAYRELSIIYPHLHLVLTGGGRLGIADLELIHRLKLEERITHLNCTDEELNYLYQQAALFVYPSLYEGFGLPILEAFKAGCPVLLSDTECFKEIGSDAVVFFSSNSKDDLINQVQKILSDSLLRSAMVEKGRKRLLDFPLDKSIEETLKLYRRLC